MTATTPHRRRPWHLLLGLLLLAAIWFPAVRDAGNPDALAPPAAPGRTAPWPTSYDAALGSSVAGLVAIVLISAITAVLGWLVGRDSAERRPSFPLRYQPPDHLGPVQTVYVASETVGPNPLVATVLHLAERGVVRLDRTSDTTWRLTRTGTSAEWKHIDPVSRQVAADLHVATGGAVLDVDGSGEAAHIVAFADLMVRRRASAWSVEHRLTQVDADENGWTVLAVVASVAALVIAAAVTPSIVALPFATFAISALHFLWGPGIGERRTAKGRQLWSQAGGFERMLATPPSQDRYEFALTRDLWLTYLPYAVAFGSADAWDDHFVTSTGHEAPMPSWYPLPPGSRGTSTRPSAAFTGLDAAMTVDVRSDGTPKSEA